MIFRLFLEKGIAFFYGATGSQPAFQDSAVYRGSIHSWFDKSSPTMNSFAVLPIGANALVNRAVKNFTAKVTNLFIFH